MSSETMHKENHGASYHVPVFNVTMSSVTKTASHCVIALSPLKISYSEARTKSDSNPLIEK